MKLYEISNRNRKISKKLSHFLHILWSMEAVFDRKPCLFFKFKDGFMKDVGVKPDLVKIFSKSFHRVLDNGL